ncbi:MAG: hypothetical protein JNN16_18100 [Nitrospira sp.]|nr:hypothetical protein [Nitrospira sp.]
MKKIKVPRSNTSIADQPLSAEAKKEYRKILLSFRLPRERVDLLLSKEGIDQLRKAQSGGINPENILVLCGDSFAMGREQDPLLKVNEAHKAADDLRNAACILHKWLPRALFAMPEPPLCEQLFPITAKDSLVELGTLLTPTKMNTLWDVAGRDIEKGLIWELAKAFDESTTTLKGMKPQHHPVQLGEEHFLIGWDHLVRSSHKKQRPCNDLGAWFLKATFGQPINRDYLETDWFRNKKKRAVEALEEQTQQRHLHRKKQLAAIDPDTPPEDSLDPTTWAIKEAERVEKKFPGKKSYRPPKTPV